MKNNGKNLDTNKFVQKKQNFLEGLIIEFYVVK